MGSRTLACLALAMTAGAGPAAAQRGIVSEQGAPAESPDAAALSVERAWRNYNAIVGGTRQLWQLSPIELQEVMLLDRDVRGLEPDRRSPREKCLDSELDRLGAPPTELALRSIDLKCSQR